MSQIISYDNSVVKTLTGNAGGAISPTSGNISIEGTTPLVVTGTPGTSTLTIDTDGTVAFTYTTDAGNAVAALDTLNVLGGLNIDTSGTGSTVTVNLSGTTDHALQIGNVGGSLDSLAVAGNGELLIGSVGANPTWSSLTSAGGTIVFTPGAGSLNLETTAGAAPSYLTDDANTATPLLGVLTIAGGDNIATSSAGSTVAIALNGNTNHALTVGNALGSLNSLAIGTATQILQSSGAADPTWSTATYPATTAQGDVMFSSAANTVDSLTKDATATRYIANTGAANSPAWDQIELTNGVSGILPAANGGTGVSTFTSHGLLLGNGAGDIQVLAEASDGQIPIGSTGNNPTLATLTAGIGVGITNAAGSIVIDAPGVDQINILYVGKHGNDANDGLTIEKALLTFGAAITAAVVLAVPVSICCFDEGTYTENLTGQVDVHIFAPNCSIAGAHTIAAGNKWEFGNAAVATGTTGFTFNSAGNVAKLIIGRLTSAGTGICTACIAGDLYLRTYRVTLEAGYLVGTATAGEIFIRADVIHMTGAATVIGVIAGAHIDLLANHIHDVAGTATLIYSVAVGASNICITATSIEIENLSNITAATVAHLNAGRLTGTLSEGGAAKFIIGGSEKIEGVPIGAGTASSAVFTTLGATGDTNINITGAGNTNLNTDAGTGTVAIGNAAAGAITADTSAGISLDAATASNFTVTGAGQDLTLSAAGGSVKITASEAVNSAIEIDATAGAGGCQIKGGSGGIFIGNESDTTLVNIADSVCSGANKVVSLGSGGVVTANSYTVNIGSGDLGLIAANKYINIGSGATPFGTSRTNIAPGSGPKIVNIGAADGLTATNIDGVTKINDSINQATSINTGTSTGATHIGDGTGSGAVTIGNTTSGGAIGLQSALSNNITIGTVGAAGSGNISLNAGTAKSIDLTAPKITALGRVEINEAGTLETRIGIHSTGATTINGGTASGSVYIAANGNPTSTVTIGNTAAGNINLISGATITARGATTINATGALATTIGNNGATVNIDGPTLINDSINQATSINTGTSTGLTTIGSTANGGGIDLYSKDADIDIESAGTGDVNINNATAGAATRIGSTTSSSVYILGGTNNVNINEAATAGGTFINTGGNSGSVHIASRVSSAIVYIASGSSSGTASGDVYIGAASSGTASGAVYAGNATGGIDFFGAYQFPTSLGNAGDLLTIAAGPASQLVWAAPASDKRLKTDVVGINPKESLDQICKLRPVEFSFIPELKDKYGVAGHLGRHAGLIAQETEQVIPTVVCEKGLFEDNTPLYKVEYEELVPYLIGAVQELTKRISKYEKVFDKLKIKAQEL